MSDMERELSTLEDSVLTWSAAVRYGTGCKRDGCKAPILWLEHLANSRLAPIDADPAPNGNIIIDLDAGTYAVLSGDRLVEARRAGEPLRLNHFVSCANPPGRER